MHGAGCFECISEQQVDIMRDKLCYTEQSRDGEGAPPPLHTMYTCIHCHRVYCTNLVFSK